MRYLEIKGKVVFAPSQLVSHSQLAQCVSACLKEISSAGFLAPRYDESKPWKTHGKSTGLGLVCNPQLQIGTEVWAGLADDTLQTVVFSTSPDLLKGLSNVEKCVWGMTDEGFSGECAVYVPLHSMRNLRADEVIGM